MQAIIEIFRRDRVSHRESLWRSLLAVACLVLAAATPALAQKNLLDGPAPNWDSKCPHCGADLSDRPVRHSATCSWNESSIKDPDYPFSRQGESRDSYQRRLDAYWRQVEANRKRRDAIQAAISRAEEARRELEERQRKAREETERAKREAEYKARQQKEEAEHAQRVARSRQFYEEMDRDRAAWQARQDAEDRRRAAENRAGQPDRAKKAAGISDSAEKVQEDDAATIRDVLSSLNGAIEDHADPASAPKPSRRAVDNVVGGPASGTDLAVDNLERFGNPIVDPATNLINRIGNSIEGFFKPNETPIPDRSSSPGQAPIEPPSLLERFLCDPRGPSAGAVGFGGLRGLFREVCAPTGGSGSLRPSNRDRFDTPTPTPPSSVAGPRRNRFDTVEPTNTRPAQSPSRRDRFDR